MSSTQIPDISGGFGRGCGVHRQNPGRTDGPLKAPFPWAGGKSKVADLVWERLGNVDNYVEPFAGSLAVLLRRPAGHFANGYRVETVNDADHFLCLDPGTRVLRSDLSWAAIGEVKEGDQLIGFDESNRGARPGLRAPQGYRKWRRATVTRTARVVKPCYRLTFDDGTTVIASADHLWLGGSHASGGRGWRWVKTESLVCDRKNQRSWILKLCEVTQREETWEGGWLGGIYDGEGSVSASVGWRLQLAQNKGITLDRAERLLSERGFKFTRKDRDGGCSTLAILGGMREVLRLLMLVRPERLVANTVAKIEGSSLYGRSHQAVGLVKKEFLGEREVVAVETDTHTFIAEGLASHNCNFWRAVRADPDAVAEHADWPVMEADLHARHKWLMRSEYAANWRERMASDPDHYDAKIAGWWCWGLCCWIGSGWCSGGTDWVQKPELAADTQKGINGGWLGTTDRHSRPQLTDAFDLGRGVNGGAASLQRPHITTRGTTGDGVLGAPSHGTTDARRAWLTDWMRRLADRLRLVRTCYGHWSRICDSDSTLARLGTTGVFLDSPYAFNIDRLHKWVAHLEGRGEAPGKATGKKSRADGLYANDGSQDVDRLVAEVHVWCKKWGGNKDIRIAVCGYEGEHNPLEELGWEKVAWSASGGYGNQRKDKKGKADNANRERLWFSPGCLGPVQPDLFSTLTEADA